MCPSAPPVQPSPAPDSFVLMAGPTSSRAARIRGIWHDPRIRRRFWLTLVSGAVFLVFLAIGVWTRACAGDRCPSIAGINGSNEDQASKVYAADGRQIADY